MSSRHASEKIAKSRHIGHLTTPNKLKFSSDCYYLISFNFTELWEEKNTKNNLTFFNSSKSVYRLDV